MTGQGDAGGALAAGIACRERNGAAPFGSAGFWAAKPQWRRFGSKVGWLAQVTGPLASPSVATSTANRPEWMLGAALGLKTTSTLTLLAGSSTAAAAERTVVQDAELLVAKPEPAPAGRPRPSTSEARVGEGAGDGWVAVDGHVADELRPPSLELKAVRPSALHRDQAVNGIVGHHLVGGLAALRPPPA